MMQRLKIYAKLIVERLIVIFFRLRSWWPIWCYILNREPRALYRSSPPNTSRLESEIVRELKTTGIAVTSIGDLFRGEFDLEVLKRLVERYRREKRGVYGDPMQNVEHRRKSFLEYLFDVEPIIDFSNPFFELSLSNPILNIVNSYFELYSKFYYLTLNITHPVEEAERPTSSQRWHRDPEDKRLCKVFLYLSNVNDEGAGPFTYIRESAYGMRYGRLFPQKPPRGAYPKDGLVEAMVPREYRAVYTGRVGTIIFCDTSGLHRGGYATTRERIMLTAGFRSKASPWLYHIRYPEGVEKKFKQHSPSDALCYALKPYRPPVGSFVLYSILKPLFEKKTGK